MKKITLLFLSVLFSGCANNDPLRLWEASSMAALPYTNASLKEKNSEKLSATIHVADIREMIRVKEKVETAAGPMRAKLFVAEGNVPNGFSMISPEHGPVIAVNIGMINLIGRDGDAMAALVGHELAHLYLKHGRTRKEREETRAAASAFLSVALGMAGVPVPFEAMDLATAPITKQFSRDEERDADQVGVKYMVQAGFDPYGAVRLQEKLGTISHSDSISFLSSHPSSIERVENMKRLAADYKATQATDEANSQGNTNSDQLAPHQ